ncbi:hypothetical protein [Pseudarthrobacter sp. DSP2-3-2b1]|uniref:hypothetical protein n=1 Tax=Pseudarthrobacter sp. DSP2-3-2b1 TaxID=2804661 RepID=UPI003CF7F63C
MRLNRFKTATAVALIAAGVGTAVLPANAAENNPAACPAFTFGVIGDIPYGAAEIAKFPARIQDINADSELKFVAHVGDIKNGSSAVLTNTSNTSAPSSAPSSTR